MFPYSKHPLSPTAPIPNPEVLPVHESCPSPLPTAAPSPIPKAVPSLTNIDLSSFIQTKVDPFIKQLTTITSFLNPWDCDYELDKQNHWAHLEKLRAHLASFPLHVEHFDCLLKALEASRTTFMVHDTLLHMLAISAKDDPSFFGSRAILIEQASQNSVSILEDSLKKLKDEHWYKRETLTQTIGFESCRSSALHQFLSYGGALEIKEAHFLVFQNNLIQYCRENALEKKNISTIHKDLLYPVLEACSGKILEESQKEKIKTKIKNLEPLEAKDLREARYCTTKSANNLYPLSE